MASSEWRGCSASGNVTPEISSPNNLNVIVSNRRVYDACLIACDVMFVFLLLFHLLYLLKCCLFGEIKINIYLKSHTTKIHQIFFTRYLWPWRSPALTAMQYVMYFWFVDDVMFSRNRANKPESKTTRMFRPVRQVAAPGTKFVVSDCMLLFQ